MLKFEHGGNIYDSGGQVSDWLDMSANINPLGLSEAVKLAIEDNIGGLIHYPDPQALELKSAISSRYEVCVENIITLNGAAEFFYLFFNTIRPKRVLIVVPSFSEYERAALAADCDIEYFYTNEIDDFNIDFDQLIKIVEAKNINCVVLANPNNPTGTIIKLNDIKKLLNVSEFVMIDESFIDFVDIESARSLVKNNKHLVVVQSLTKFFAIPGLRLGFAIADESIVKRLELGKDVWNVNYLAQKVGVAALSDKEYFSKTRNWITKEKKYVAKHLEEISNIKYFKPTVNFVLIKFETDKMASTVIEKLRQNKILIRSCANFIGLNGSYLRMAIRCREDNDRVINLVESVLKG